MLCKYCWFVCLALFNNLLCLQIFYIIYFILYICRWNVNCLCVTDNNLLIYSSSQNSVPDVNDVHLNNYPYKSTHNNKNMNNSKPLQILHFLYNPLHYNSHNHKLSHNIHLQSRNYVEKKRFKFPSKCCAIL
jgi:hypothetical protein